MFSCQVKDVFDHATLKSAVYVPTHVQRGCMEHSFYMWRIHNFHTTCQLPVVFRVEGTRCTYVESVPIHIKF